MAARTRILVAVLLALLGPGAEGARACSVCLAGDPNFSTHGSASQERGSVAVYFEVRGWEKSSGVLAPERAGDATGAAPAAAPFAPAALTTPALEGRVRGGGKVRRSAAPAVAKQRRDALASRQGHSGHEHEEDDLDLPVPGQESGGSAGSEEESTRERNESRRLDLYVAWTPLDRVTLTLNLPWAINSIEEIAHDGSEHFSLDGFGDASLGVSGVVWRNRDVMPSTWVEARGWGKAPTGRDERRVDGVQDPHLQAGTGSWDFGFGSAVVHRFDWGSLYGSGFYRVNTEGGLDYEYGDVVLATAAVEVPLGHASGVRALDRVTPGLGLDFRWADRDRQYGSDVEDTGGSILYATPSLRIALPSLSERQRAWLRAGVQVPLTNAWLYGEQDEDPVWSVGIGYGF